MGIGGRQSACLCIARGGRTTHIRLFRYALLASVAFGISACSESQTGSPTQPSAASATATSRAPQPLTAGPKEPEVANPTVAVPTPRTQIISGSGVLIGSTPTQGAAATPQGDITLSFVNADVREVLPRVLGDILHLNYAVDPKVQGTITVQTSRPIRQQDVLPVLQETLRASGLALVEANGVYRVTTSDEAAHTGTAAVTVGARPPGAPVTAGINVQIIPLKYASAPDLQRALQPFLPKDAVLQADTTRNLLMLSGATADLSTVTDMVRAFDVDWIAGMSYGIVPLQTAAPKTVADELTTIFGPKGSVPLPGMLSFAPLDRMNAILVVSPQRSYIEQARMWIERLDRGETENRPRIFEYHVQNSRAADLARVLTRLFASGQVSTVQPQTAPGTNATTLGSGFTGVPGAGGSLGGAGGGAGLPPSLGAGLTTSSNQGTGMLGASGLGGGNAAARPGAPSDQSAAENEGGGAGGPSGGGGAESGAGTGGQALQGLELPPMRIVADEKNNSLVVYARPRDYRVLEDALRRIDVAPLEVLIEATIAEVSLGNDLQYGLQYFFHQHENQFTFRNPNPASSSNPVLQVMSGINPMFPGFNYILGSTNANVVVNLLSSITNVHVISSPQLLVLDHQSASLLVGNAVPIPTAQIQSQITQGAPIVNTVQYVDTGVILHVTPRVNAGGLVTLEVGQEVSAVSTTASAQTAAFGPTITERRIQSSVTVQDGETIALGGLIQDTNSVTKGGLPLLSDIPVIGSVFGTTDRSVQRTELLVLLSPHVVHNTFDARAVTEELRNRLHSLSSDSAPIR
jgi:general secretion pathway protein D